MKDRALAKCDVDHFFRSPEENFHPLPDATQPDLRQAGLVVRESASLFDSQQTIYPSEDPEPYDCGLHVLKQDIAFGADRS